MVAREKEEERLAALWVRAPALSEVLIWPREGACEFVILLVTGQRQAGSIFKLSLLLKAWYMKVAISVLPLSQCTQERVFRCQRFSGWSSMLPVTLLLEQRADGSL